MYSPDSPNRRTRRIFPLQSVATQRDCPIRATIGGLSDEALLNIFRYYLDASPRVWLVLVHICRKWRRIISQAASQRALHLRLFCTHGTPSLKTLDHWPSLPIIVEYGGALELDPPALEDEENIMAALGQSDRVSSISLTVTSSLLEKLFTIERPFSELEELVLLSQDDLWHWPTHSSAFRWCPRLRRLHSTRVAFPALLQLLHSSMTLVDLHLHEVLNPLHLSPEVLTNALSGMAQLRSLSLYFLSTATYYTPTPPSRERVVLPVLSHLKFRGIPGYLEGLVARINAPCLGDIEVTFFNEGIFGPELSAFITNRIAIHKSHCRAYIRSSERAVSVSLIQSGAPTCLTFHLFCEPLSRQLLSITHHFSTFLCNVEDLRISATRPSRRGGSARKWRVLLSSFTAVKQFHLDGSLSTDVVRALQLQDWQGETVLPDLHKLYIPQPGPRHAPLKESVVTFMTSRGLSGHYIAMEYERISELHRRGPFSHQVTIEMLSDDILLNIFRHCLDPTPQIWPTLAWVCPRWRQIVLASPLGLNLRLYCTYGTPVSKTLDFWPALPIIVKYRGFPDLDPPSPEDDNNVIAALKQSGRVSSINLTVTSSLLEKLPAISEQFSRLEELVLLSQDNVQLTLPSTFRWGPLLRTLHSTRITFPSFPQLLSPSQDLVDLRLHKIPSAEHFPPEAFANAMSGMTNLRTLSLHFLSFPPRRNYLGLPPQQGGRVILPSLSCLAYRGTSKYLDSFVARIDAPGLGDIDITFFVQPMIDASQLGRFIERTEMQASLSRAEVRSSGHAISISFTSSDISESTPLRLQISCKQLDWQLSSMAQVCDQFSPFIFRVDNLHVNTTQSPSGQDGVDGEQWLGLVRAFGGAKDLRVAGVHVEDILCALRPADGEHTTDTAVLPALCNLHVQKLNLPLWDIVRSFTTSRRLSGRPVQAFTKGYYSCHICYSDFTKRRELKIHLIGRHAYRRMCSHCSDFERTPGHSHLFREHLENKHPGVARNNAPFSKPLLTGGELNILVHRHSSLRAPEIAAPFTTGIPTELHFR